MRIRRGILAIACGATCAVLLAAQAGHAQYLGPGAEQAPANLAAILDNPVDDQHVVLRGHLLRKLGKEHYLFSDGSAEMTVEIDDDDLPRQPIDDRVLVELDGEVEAAMLAEPRIEVERLTIVGS